MVIEAGLIRRHEVAAMYVKFIKSPENTRASQNPLTHKVPVRNAGKRQE